MATFQNFEDIEAWQKARELTRKIYAMTGQSSFFKDYGLRDQVRRASVSIISNIAEGFDRSGAVEFGRFLSMAKGSTGEVKAQLYVAWDLGYITKEQFDELFTLVSQIGRLIGGLMSYLRQTPIKGAKFK